MMSKILRNAALGLLALSMGCSHTAPADSTMESIKVAELPDVRGCDSLGKLQQGIHLKLQMVEGVGDLFLVSAGGRPACADSWSGVFLALSAQGVHMRELAASNPMPGTDPSTDANSNPMPGTDPASSNPMPGTDPSSGSNGGNNGPH